MESLGFDTPWYDPYNQNPLKGDIPWKVVDGKNSYITLAAISDTLIEPRSGPEAEERAFEEAVVAAAEPGAAETHEQPHEPDVAEYAARFVKKAVVGGGNADKAQVHFMVQRLLPDVPAPRVARNGRYSPSALVWHVGVRGTLPDGVGHHNIYFGKAWDESFRELLDDGHSLESAATTLTQTMTYGSARYSEGWNPLR